MLKFNGSYHNEACKENLKNNLIRIMSFRDIREYKNVKLDRNIDKQEDIEINISKLILIKLNIIKNKRIFRKQMTLKKP